MSQQTQINRVIPKYHAWIEVFPNAKSLAHASITEVLRVWSGLGYNRRALYLKRAAEVVVHDYQSKFPQEIELLKKLPGVGEYTARAIACFAFDEQIAVVDTNIRKVILVEFYKKVSVQAKITEKQLQEIADQLLPKDQAYHWNQALMDYAATMLKRHKIPVPKQSTFMGSNRYYRGKILKLLLERQRVSIQQLAKLIDYDEAIAKAPLAQIIQSMVKDNLIEQEQAFVTLLTV